MGTNQGESLPGTLSSLSSPRIDQRTVLRGLALGFSVVILLLATSAVTAVRRTHAIRTASAGLLREQQTVAAAMDDLQLSQQRMSTLLLDLFDDERGSIHLKNAATALERDIRRVAAEGERLEPHPAWAKLRVTGDDFAAAARQLLNTPPRKRGNVEFQLQALRGDFVALCNEIVQSQADTAASLERQIEQQSMGLTRDSAWLLGACLVLSLVGAGMTIRITQRSFRTMEWQAQELNRVSWNMLQTQEAAARRFSHEMHDELGQALTGLKTSLMVTLPGDFVARRHDSLHLLDEAIGKVRELSQLLHPVILDDFGVQTGLRWLADRFSERTRIEVEYECAVSGRLADGIETHLFRITQEALTNIARHSGATKVSIHFTESGGAILLTIEDNGCGFKPEARRKPSLGMVGMRARARQIDGELTVAAGSSGGVKLEVRAPRREAQADATEEDARVAG
jgi:signal transduction histidine kinase